MEQREKILKYLDTKGLMYLYYDKNQIKHPKKLY